MNTDCNLDSRILGLSATPIRHLDQQRDMAYELFLGNISSEITLSEAIARGLLPTPTYVTCLYSLQDEINRIQTKIDNSKIKSLKSTSQTKLNQAKRLLDKSTGISDMFERHIKIKNGRYIVFCTNYIHMKKMQKECVDWFTNINSELTIYEIFSSMDDNDFMKVLYNFSNNNDNSIKLLFVINMLNEGVHIDNIDGIIMLRPTSSKNIFVQQLGRALSCGKNKLPLIFDVVNNVTQKTFISNFKDEVYNRVGNNVTINISDFIIHSEMQDFCELIESIECELNFKWMHYYSLAKKYFDLYGNLDVHNDYVIDGVSLGRWISNQRVLYQGNSKRGSIDEYQIELLNDIGMIWDKLEAKWNAMYNIAKEYYEQYGNLLPPQKDHDGTRSRLHRWVSLQRDRYHNRNSSTRKITDAEIKLLNDIGMVWENTMDLKWSRNYDKLVLHYKKYGTINKKKNYIADNDETLLNWVSNQKSNYKGKSDHRKLTKNQIEKLENLNINWNSYESQWEANFNKCKQYVVNGRLNVPEKESSLFAWVNSQKTKKRNGTLSKERKMALDSIGISWGGNEEKWFKMYVKAKKIYEKAGSWELKKGEHTDIKKWFKMQRRIYNRGTMPQSKIDLLTKIDFQFVTKE